MMHIGPNFVRSHCSPLMQIPSTRMADRQTVPAKAPDDENGPTKGKSRFDRKWEGGRRVLLAAEEVLRVEGGDAWRAWLAPDCKAAQVILRAAEQARNQGRGWQRLAYYAMEHVLHDHAPEDPALGTEVCPKGKLWPGRAEECIEKIAKIAERADRAQIRRQALQKLPEHHQAAIRKEAEDAAADGSAAALKSMPSAAVPKREAEDVVEPIHRKKKPLPLPIPRLQKAQPAAMLKRGAEDGAAPPPKKMHTKSSKCIDDNQE